MIGMTSFTAEAGKTYFFDYTVDIETTRTQGSFMGAGGGGSTSGTQKSVTATLSQLHDDEAAFRVKSSTPAQFTQKSE